MCCEACNAHAVLIQNQKGAQLSLIQISTIKMDPRNALTLMVVLRRKPRRVTDDWWSWWIFDFHFDRIKQLKLLETISIMNLIIIIIIIFT